MDPDSRNHGDVSTLREPHPASVAEDGHPLDRVSGTLARSLVSGDSCDSALRQAFELCRQSLGATAGYLALSSSQGFSTPGRAANGAAEADLPLMRSARTVRQQACASGSVVVDNHAGPQERSAPAVAAWDNLLVAPVMLGGRTEGEIALANKPGGFTRSDIAVVQAFADMAALALQHARLAADKKLLDAQLGQARKMEAVGTLACGIAHDFNNLLTGLAAGLGLMELKLSPKHECLHDVAELRTLVNRGAELTRQLLGFARRGKFNLRCLDLAAVVQEAAVIYARTRQELRIDVQCAPGLRVLADRTQLDLVLLNLLVHAGRNLQAGGTIRVRAEPLLLQRPPAEFPETSPGAYVRLSVSDADVPAPADAAPEPLEVNLDGCEPGIGSGLGMASVYGIVRNHGGLVSRASTAGLGSIFTVLLPATQRPLEPSARHDADPPGHGELILVVDDERAVVQYCARMLKVLGYDVLTACHGMEAITLMQRYGRDVSLVILDLVMPGMSGSRVFDEVRQMVPGLPVLLSSGRDIEGQARDLLAAGADGFLQKPFGMSELSAALRELLGTRRSGTAGSPG